MPVIFAPSGGSQPRKHVDMRTATPGTVAPSTVTPTKRTEPFDPASFWLWLIAALILTGTFAMFVAKTDSSA
jgi:hypothetical protein